MGGYNPPNQAVSKSPKTFSTPTQPSQLKAAKLPSKIFNNHSDKSAHVRVTVNGKDDYVTVMPRGKVTLPKGSKVHSEEYKNPFLRIA